MLSPEEITGSKIERQITIEELEEMQKQGKTIRKLKKEEREIYEILKEEQSMNEISIKTGIPIQELYMKLLVMEMEGIIISRNGKYQLR